MKKMDRDGLILCDIQGKAFEDSLEYQSCSSPVFIRRFMLSDFSKRMDNYGYLNEASTITQIYDELDEQYGKTDYGKTKYTKNELFWIGYIYRYFCVVYEISSKRAYKLIKPKELRDVYYPYHTLDPLFAIDRILEAKNIKLPKTEEEKIKQGVEILRRIRARQGRS